MDVLVGPFVTVLRSAAQDPRGLLETSRGPSPPTTPRVRYASVGFGWVFLLLCWFAPFFEGFALVFCFCFFNVPPWVHNEDRAGPHMANIMTANASNNSSNASNSSSNASNSSMHDAGEDEFDAVSIAFGLVIMVFAGTLLAFSMTVQRHALAFSSRAADGRVPLLCWRVHRLAGWFVGLVLYGGASGLKVAAFNLGPFTILASVFVGTLLITNLVFGRWLLKERLTPPKVLGSLTVLTGACVCVGGTPGGIPTSFSTSEMEAMFFVPAPKGGCFLAVVLCVVVLCVAFIVVMERKYPLRQRKPRRPATAITAPSNPTTNGSTCTCGSSSGDSGGSDATALVGAASARGHAAPLAPPPPRWINTLMVLVYPGSLGLDESLADLCVRAYSSMFVKCGVDGSDCAHWTVFLLVGVGVTAAVGTVGWLKVVFERYETTLALPIEYGALNLFSVLGGLLFFGEGEYMEAWQLSLVLSGCGIILLGIAIGLLDDSCHRPHSVSLGEQQHAGASPRLAANATPASAVGDNADKVRSAPTNLLVSQASAHSNVPLQSTCTL